MNPAAGSAVHAHTGAWVAQVLRRRISDGELRPGAQLTEQALSAELAVSRNTLREAFTALAAESIVHRVPNRGVFVASPDAGDIRDVYQVRRMLEPAALLWGELTAARQADLRRIRASIARARDAGDAEGMASANQRLHDTIVALSGSPTLTTVMDRTLARMRLVFHRVGDSSGFHAPYADRNLELLDLVLSGRRTEAAEALRGYLDTAERELLGRLGH